MTTICLFGKNVTLKTTGCSKANHTPERVYPAVNLFVKVTNSCNARCRFCSNGCNAGTNETFDYNRLWLLIDELRNRGVLVNRLNITGGEPALVKDRVFDILEAASQKHNRDLHLHLNTNGLLPDSQMLMRHPRWNSISMSIHHYDINRLSEIYGVRITPDAFDFRNINLSKVNASCNLIRGYIDSAVEIERMLRFATHLKLPRIGLVSLMKINSYCCERFIDYEDIDFQSIPNLSFIESHFSKSCSCSNYSFKSGDKSLQVYIRKNLNPGFCESSLTYDGRHWHQGFNNENIIY